CHVNLVCFPQHAAFHPACNHQRLTGKVAGEPVGRQENGCGGYILRSGQLRQGHGRCHLADPLSATQFRLGAWNDRPPWAKAVHTASAVTASVWGQARDFVLKRPRQAKGHRTLGGGVIRMSSFTEDASGGSDQDGVPMLLVLNQTQEFAYAEK